MLPLLFDAVIFDLDGTLVATEAFWVAAGRAGARRAFEELGLERELPGPEVWLGMCGLPLEQGFERAFPDLDPAARALLLARCVEEEESALSSGGARLAPGAATVLARLNEAGVRVGLASNCAESYLRAITEGLGLARYVQAARCLDSPRVRTKTDMVRDLLAEFGTRSAVMVGDRAGDREAAHANGIPHVHVASGFGQAGEEREAEAILADLGELLPLLERRAVALDGALRALGLHPERRGGPRLLGVSGLPLAGASLFARDAARLLRSAGRPVEVSSLEPWRVAPGAGPESFDLVRARREVLEPYWRASGRGELAPGAVRILEGPGLTSPAIAAGLDRVVWLDVSAAVARRRVGAREGWEPGSGPLRRWEERVWGSARAQRRRWPPERAADLLLDGDDCLVPARLNGALRRG